MDSGKRRLRLIAAGVLVLAAACAGCTRIDVLTGRLKSFPDDRARQVVSDCLWADGSVYKWAAHKSLRLRVVRTDHLPLGDRSSDEVWLLDLAGGQLRIEKPAVKQVIAYDGAAWRVFVDGRETRDLELRAAAAGDAMILRQIAPLPFVLVDAGLKITYIGTRAGPGGTRVWDRLFVTYPGPTPWSAADRTVVEIQKDPRRLDAALVCWAAAPFLGGCYRVELDEWLPTADGIVLSRRWRWIPVSDAGAPTGPVRWTFRVADADFDAPVKMFAFSQP